MVKNQMWSTLKMEDFIDEMYALIQKYQKERSMTFGEAIGYLKLMSDELSERCRKGWNESRENNNNDEKWRG